MHTARCNNIHENTKKATSDKRKQLIVNTIISCPCSSSLSHYSHSHGFVALADCNTNGQRYVTLAKTTPSLHITNYQRPPPFPLLSVI